MITISVNQNDNKIVYFDVSLETLIDFENFYKLTIVELVKIINEKIIDNLPMGDNKITFSIIKTDYDFINKLYYHTSENDEGIYLQILTSV